MTTSEIEALAAEMTSVVREALAPIEARIAALEAASIHRSQEAPRPESPAVPVDDDQPKPRLRRAGVI